MFFILIYILSELNYEQGYLLVLLGNEEIPEAINVSLEADDYGALVEVAKGNEFLLGIH